VTGAITPKLLKRGTELHPLIISRLWRLSPKLPSLGKIPEINRNALGQVSLLRKRKPGVL
jgi:hypothetical protein